jgi:hypothetical protein
MPLQGLYPPSHVKVHAPLEHAGCALGTLVEHALPQAPQWLASFVVSTQMFPHWVGEAGGQLIAHAYVPATEAQSGVSPPHTLSQAPQLKALAESTQPPWHAMKPLAQPPSAPSAASPAFASPPSARAAELASHTGEHSPDV